MLLWAGKTVCQHLHLTEITFDRNKHKISISLPVVWTSQLHPELGVLFIKVYKLTKQNAVFSVWKGFWGNRVEKVVVIPFFCLVRLPPSRKMNENSFMSITNFSKSHPSLKTWLKINSLWKAQVNFSFCHVQFSFI